MGKIAGESGSRHGNAGAEFLSPHRSLTSPRSVSHLARLRRWEGESGPELSSDVASKGHGLHCSTRDTKKAQSVKTISKANITG